MTDRVRKPSRIRFALFVFCFVYPLVTVLQYLTLAFTPGWEMWQRSFILVPIVVVAMVFMIIPFIQQRLTRWI